MNVVKYKLNLLSKSNLPLTGHKMTEWKDSVEIVGYEVSHIEDRYDPLFYRCKTCGLIIKLSGKLTKFGKPKLDAINQAHPEHPAYHR